MKQFIIVKYQEKTINLSGVIKVVIGSVFLGLISQIAIPLPFTPVPITLQTLGVSLLAISLGPRKAPMAVLTYLFQATLGLPVLAGGVSNPLWMATPKAGYLVGFVFAAYLTATLIEKYKKTPLWKIWFALSANDGLILTIGACWLSFFVGFEKGFLLGFVPFIPGALVKISMAWISFRPLEWIGGTHDTK